MSYEGRFIAGMVFVAGVACQPTGAPEDAGAGGGATGGASGEGVTGGGTGEGQRFDAAAPGPDVAIAPPDAAPLPLDTAVSPPDIAVRLPDATPLPADAAPPLPDAAPPLPDAAPLLPDAAPPLPDAAPPLPDAGVDPLTCTRGDLRVCDAGGRVGHQFCAWNETWSDCVAPVDVCANGLDDDHDGVVDEGCTLGGECNGNAADMCAEWFQICIAGTCVDDEWNIDFPNCTDSADCPGFAACDDTGLCVPRDCDFGEEDCPWGQYCGEGLCRTPLCPDDAFEPDDTSEDARALLPGVPESLHTLCEDPDWRFVSARAGEAWRLTFDGAIGQRVTVGAGPTIADPLQIDFVAEADGRIPIRLEGSAWGRAQGAPVGVRVGLTRLGAPLALGAPCEPAGAEACGPGLRCGRGPGEAAASCRVAPRIDAVRFHAVDAFVTLVAIEGSDPDGPPTRAWLTRGDGRLTVAHAYWAVSLPGDRFEFVGVDVDLGPDSLGGTVSLALEDRAGAFFGSVVDPVAEGPREVGAAAPCDADGIARTCAPGLACDAAPGDFAGVCAPVP